MATRLHHMRANKTHEITYEAKKTKITPGQRKSIRVVNKSAKYRLVFCGTCLADTLRDPDFVTKRVFLKLSKDWVCWLKVGEEFEHGGCTKKVSRLPTRFEDWLLFECSEENGSIHCIDLSVEFEPESWSLHWLAMNADNSEFVTKRDRHVTPLRVT